MPNLGPFGEALGRAIAPALKAASGKADKFLEKSMQERVYPTIGKLVEGITGGGSRYVPPEHPIGSSAWREAAAKNQAAVDWNKKSLDMELEDRKRILNHPDLNEESLARNLRSNLYRTEHAEYIKRESKRVRNEELFGRTRDTEQGIPIGAGPEDWGAREFDPSKPESVPAVINRMIRPLNEAEVSKNVAVFANTARIIRRVTPPPLFDLLPPSAQGLIHWVSGDGKPTDMGLSWDKVKNVPKKLLGKIDFSKGVDTSLDSYVNTAAKLLQHPGFEGIEVWRMKPLDFSGPLGNAVGKAFIVRRADGGWDLVDDYRFYDHVEKFPRPVTRDEAAETSQNLAREYVKLQDVPRQRIREATERPIGKILAQLDAWATQHLKNNPKLQYKLHRFNYYWQLNSGEGIKGLSFNTDKMLIPHGKPFPVHIKDIDKVIAASKARASSGKEFDAALEFVRGHFDDAPYLIFLPQHPSAEAWASTLMQHYWAGHTAYEHTSSNAFNPAYTMRQTLSPFTKAVIDERLETEPKSFLKVIQDVLDVKHRSFAFAPVRLLEGMERHKAMELLIKHWDEPMNLSEEVTRAGSPNNLWNYLNEIAKKHGLSIPE